MNENKIRYIIGTLIFVLWKREFSGAYFATMVFWFQVRSQLLNGIKESGAYLYVAIMLKRATYLLASSINFIPTSWPIGAQGSVSFWPRAKVWKKHHL